MYRTEFHIHTRYSHDSMMGRFALLTMCKLRHVDCVAITDHNEVAGAQAYRSFLEKHGIQVIVGEEVFTDEGEIVGLFLSRRIESGLTPEETIAQIKEQGGIVYVPHPYDEKRSKTVLSPAAQERLFGQFDCMEIHNGRNTKIDYSLIQERIASEFKVGRIVGCDAHCWFELGRNCCLTSERFDKENFVEILSGASFQKKACHPLSHPATRCVRLLKMIMRGDVRGIQRVLHRKLDARK